MARIPSIPFVASPFKGGKFAASAPIGIVLHRTEAHFKHLYQTMAYGPNPKLKSSHVLIGKRDGEVVQLVDTSDIANHVGPAANDIYLGIEFESIPARPWIKGQDPLTNQDELTPFQASVGQEILTWLSSLHSIPLMGPPKKSQWMNCKGRWHGVLGHADVASGGFYKTDHGDELMFIDYIALNVWPII